MFYVSCEEMNEKFSIFIISCGTLCFQGLTAIVESLSQQPKALTLNQRTIKTKHTVYYNLTMLV